MSIRVLTKIAIHVDQSKENPHPSLHLLISLLWSHFSLPGLIVNLSDPLKKSSHPLRKPPPPTAVAPSSAPDHRQ